MRRAPPGPAEQQGPTRMLVPGAGRTLQGHSGAWRQSVTVHTRGCGCEADDVVSKTTRGPWRSSTGPTRVGSHLASQRPAPPPPPVHCGQAARLENEGGPQSCSTGFPASCSQAQLPSQAAATLRPPAAHTVPHAGQMRARCLRSSGWGLRSPGGRPHHRQHLSTCGQGQLAQEGSVEGCTENHPWPPVGRCGRRPQLGLHVLASVARLDDETKSPSHVSLRACAEVEGSVGSV